MADNNNDLFKDKDQIGTKTYYIDIAEELYSRIQNGEDLESILVPNNAEKMDDREYDHSVCNIIQTYTSTEREKRICHCMYGYNSNAYSDCDNCAMKYIYKSKPNSKSCVIDFEVPTRYEREKIGGVDIMLEYDSEKYAVEVKPPNSDESLTRMIAEILTYTHALPKKYNGARPAIAFFEYQIDDNTKEHLLDKKNRKVKTVQLEEYESGECKNSAAMQGLLDMVSVFLIQCDFNKDEELFEFDFKLLKK